MPTSASNQGPSTDERNQAVADPTENVMKLVEAANKRQDDLREATARHLQDLADKGDKRIDEALKHYAEMAELRAAHSAELRNAESRRIDAVRQVDFTAARTEADRALTAIQALAATTAANADNLRNALTATATILAKQTADTVGEITTRIAALEKSSYEGQGRSKVADPQTDALVAEMRRLTAAQSGFSGERRGIGQSWGVILGVVGLIATLLSIGGVLIAVSKSNNVQAAPYYVPATPGVMVPSAPVVPH